MTNFWNSGGGGPPSGAAGGELGGTYPDPTVDNSTNIPSSGEKTWLTNALAGSVAFPATEVLSTNPNALTDYERGTWTPTVRFSGLSSGVTYGAGRAGRYTKIGQLVVANAEIPLTSKGTSSGAVGLGGLPFTNSTMQVAASVYADVLTHSGFVMSVVESGLALADMRSLSVLGVQTQLTNTDVSSGTYFAWSASYQIST